MPQSVKCLTHKRCGLSQDPHENPGRCTRVISAQVTEEALGLAGQPGLLHELHNSERPCLIEPPNC